MCGWISLYQRQIFTIPGGIGSITIPFYELFHLALKVGWTWLIFESGGNSLVMESPGETWWKRDLIGIAKLEIIM